MKKSRFTEEQIVFALQQAEPGTSVPEHMARLDAILPWERAAVDATTDGYDLVLSQSKAKQSRAGLLVGMRHAG